MHLDYEIVRVFEDDGSMQVEYTDEFGEVYIEKVYARHDDSDLAQKIAEQAPYSYFHRRRAKVLMEAKEVQSPAVGKKGSVSS